MLPELFLERHGSGQLRQADECGVRLLRPLGHDIARARLLVEVFERVRIRDALSDLLERIIGMLQLLQDRLPLTVARQLVQQRDDTLVHPGLATWK